jgi:hypothetical protein
VAERGGAVDRGIDTSLVVKLAPTVTVDSDGGGTPS